MGAQAVIGVDLFLVGHKVIQTVCAGGQVDERGVVVGRDFGAEIHEGEEAS